MAFDKSKYDQGWMAAHTMRFVLRFNKVNDEDIINHINAKDNKTEYIRQLVRKDIEESKKAEG